MLSTPAAGSKPRLTAAQRAAIASHYQIAAPLLAPFFGGTPLVYAAYPEGLGGIVDWHGPLRSKPANRLPTCGVPTPHGLREYLAFCEPAVLWLFPHTNAVELHGWGCTLGDPQRAQFARILLELDKEHHTALTAAATALKGLLRESGLQAIPLLQGKSGLALWIPLNGGPSYSAVRAWLHELCAIAAAAQPTLFSLEPNTHVSGRVHLHVGSNAPGRYSALPYSLRGDIELHVCTPITWDELESLSGRHITAKGFMKRIADVGDLFGVQVEAIGEQSLPEQKSLNGAHLSVPIHGKPIEPHGRILRAAAIILSDGLPRDAQTILSDALASDLVPAGTKEKYVYTSLLEYIVRTSGHGHKPLIVQDPDRRFRLNEPQDNWPATDPPPAPEVDARTQATIDTLTSTAEGSDPREFEIAVCDAFAHLGFIATHIGGNQNPDGYVDAPLGTLEYRVMLECKTGPGVVHDPDAVEAAKFREQYGAQHCALIGPGFAESVDLANELQTHRVSAWALDDLAQVLRMRCDPYEVRLLFEPGFVADRIGDVQWNRLHGPAKRVQLICRYVVEEGWDSQVDFAKADRHGSKADAPLLTVDAAMILVDRRLAKDGSSAYCSRSEVSAAFSYLTSPPVGRAIRVDTAPDDAIVVTSPTPWDGEALAILQ